MDGAELLTPKEWRRQVGWPAQGQTDATGDDGAKLEQAEGGRMGWSPPRGPGAQPGPRGVLLMLLAPPLRMPPAPAHVRACGCRMSSM